MKKWWVTRKENDDETDNQYELERKARNQVWAERDSTCHCSDPLPLRSYFKQQPCGRCSGWVK